MLHARPKETDVVRAQKAAIYVGLARLRATWSMISSNWFQLPISESFFRFISVGGNESSAQYI